jgi:FlaA1/EpsC-like NDP-sugar epimerase
MILKLRYLTLVLDYFLLQGMFILAYFMRVGFVMSSDFPFEPYFWTSLAAGLVWLSSLLVFRGYNPSIRLTRWIHITKVVIAGLTGTALFGLIFYFGQQSLFSRLLLGYIFVFGTLAMLLFHLIMQWIENSLIKKGYGNIRTLIIGSNRGVSAFIAELKKNHSPYVPVAVLDGYGTKQKDIHGVPVLGKLNILEETVDEYLIDAIVQGDNVEQVVNIVHFCDQNKLDYFLLPYLLGMYQDTLRVQMIEKPVIAPVKAGGRGWAERMLS